MQSGNIVHIRSLMESHTIKELKTFVTLPFLSNNRNEESVFIIKYGVKLF